MPKGISRNREMANEAMRIELIRLTAPERPRLGVIRLAGVPAMVSLERPWLNNAPAISCIPLGEYMAKRVKNRRTNGGMFIPETFEVTNVPERSGILFHVGNTVADTQGCILVGMRFEHQATAILESRLAFEVFMQQMAGVPQFVLEVKEFR